jgi:hypothetical protein
MGSIERLLAAIASFQARSEAELRVLEKIEHSLA